MMSDDSSDQQHDKPSNEAILDHRDDESPEDFMLLLERYKEVQENLDRFEPNSQSSREEIIDETFFDVPLNNDGKPEDKIDAEIRHLEMVFGTTTPGNSQGGLALYPYIDNAIHCNPPSTFPKTHPTSAHFDYLEGVYADGSATFRDHSAADRDNDALQDHPDSTKTNYVDTTKNYQQYNPSGPQNIPTTYKEGGEKPFFGIFEPFRIKTPPKKVRTLSELNRIDLVARGLTEPEANTLRASKISPAGTNKRARKRSKSKPKKFARESARLEEEETTTKKSIKNRFPSDVQGKLMDDFEKIDDDENR